MATQYICHRMTPSTRTRNRARPALTAALFAAVLFGCDGSSGAPRVEFIVAAGDSTYWIKTSGSAVTLRGSPMVLARLDGRFRELYVVDEDRSFENALFVGQRLYQRDLLTGDSTEVFRDTLITSLAERYERRHPEARRLAPDEDTAAAIRRLPDPTKYSSRPSARHDGR